MVPSYDLGGATVGLDIGFKLEGASKDPHGNDDKLEHGGRSQLGFGAWVQKGFDNGLIKAGVSLTTPWNYSDANYKERDGMVVRIPVILEYWF